MKMIWKFPLRITDSQVIAMPSGARILTVQKQSGAPYMWALIDPASPLTNRTILTVGTGHEAPDAVGEYIATYQIEDDSLVFHVFDAGQVQNET